MGFLRPKYNFFRKGILFPFQWGIAWYWTVNNTRDMIFLSYLAKYIKIIGWRGPLVTRRTRRSILQYLHSGISVVTNNKRLGSNILNFIIGKHAVRKTKKYETCMRIAKGRITLLAKINDYKRTYSSPKILRFKKASSGILVRRLSLSSLQNWEVQMLLY